MSESTYPMVRVEEALRLVLDEAPVLESEEVALADVQGRILTEAMRASEPLPPFRASVKDGYAVVASDGPGSYPLAGEVTAGRLADFVLRPGSVAYITTGAPVPEGADAVVMVEETEKFWGRGEEAHVKINVQVRPGDDIRPIGVDVGVGEQVLAAGDRLGPAEIGLLATVGRDRVPVVRRPRVAVLSTGDELVETGSALRPGQIRDSNRPMLLAAVEAEGGIPVDLGIGGDAQFELEERVSAGLAGADILLTSGGVSMGDLDLIKPLLERSGEVHFGRVRMKPGKPVTFATVTVEGRKRLVFGLPGNPVSSLVTYYLFTVPAMRKMAGWRNPELRRVRARLEQPLALDPVRPEYHRADLRWDEERNEFAAVSTGSQASSRLLSMRTANGLLELPQREGRLEMGAYVSALIIGDILV